MGEPQLTAGQDGNFRLQGNVNLYTASALGNVQFPDDQPTCEIDLSGVENADSGVVALMLFWHRKANRQGVELKFTGTPEHLSALIDLYDLEEIFP